MLHVQCHRYMPTRLQVHCHRYVLKMSQDESFNVTGTLSQVHAKRLLAVVGTFLICLKNNLSMLQVQCHSFMTTRFWVHCHRSMTTMPQKQAVKMYYRVKEQLVSPQRTASGHRHLFLLFYFKVICLMLTLKS